MKKSRKTALTAALFAAALSFTGCGTDEEYAVYGPPPDYESSTEESETEPETEEITESETYVPSEEEIAPLTAPETEPPTTSIQNEMPAPVYGPPSIFGLW